MYRILALFLILFISLSVHAQRFIETPIPLSFALQGVTNGSTTFEDVNGDGHPDVLVTGHTQQLDEISKLYINDGTGQFSESTTALIGVLHSAVAFADVNGDDYPDLLITGQVWNGDETSKLYINDGTGQFNESTNTVLKGVKYGSVAFADINNDSYPDILITGEGENYTRHAKLYLNDGTGQFSESTNLTLPGVRHSSIFFTDFNMDGFEDLLLTGQDQNINHITKLFINDGAGNLTADVNASFIGISEGSIGVADFNMDSYPDILLTGRSQNSLYNTILYLNDGNGQFSERANPNFVGVYNSSVAISDINEDDLPDLLITGKSISDLSTTKVYINDGTGLFNEELSIKFPEVSRGYVSFEDVDNNQLPDLIITGENESGVRIAKLYMNNGIGVFSEKIYPFLTGTYNGDVVFEDVDMDGYADVFVSGKDHFGVVISKLYMNSGTGQFVENISTSLFGLWNSSAAFEDVNMDGYADLFLTGSSQYGMHTVKLYLNNGMGQFNEEIDFPNNGIARGDIDFADVNNDSYPDLFMTGENEYGLYVSKLYLNDGTGQFSEAENSNFPGTINSSIDFADVNGDNSPDLLLNGTGVGNGYIAELYINDGTGQFSKSTDNLLMKLVRGHCSFLDINNDSHPDIFLNGLTPSNNFATALYVNDGTGHFYINENASFDNIHNGVVSFADVNADNYTDILISGIQQLSGTTKLYINNKMGGFDILADTPFISVVNGSAAFEDINLDGTPDLLLTGFEVGNAPAIGLYLNIPENIIQTTEGATLPPNTDSLSEEGLRQDDNPLDALRGVFPSNEKQIAAVPSIYPNPTKERIFIKNVLQQRVDLLNAKGQFLQKAIVDQQEVSLVGLPADAYFLRIRANGKLYTIPLVKE